MKDIKTEFKLASTTPVTTINNWSSAEDLQLLAGVSKHGVGAWETILADATFEFRKKFVSTYDHQKDKEEWPGPKILFKRLEQVLEAYKKANPRKGRIILKVDSAKKKLVIKKKRTDGFGSPIPSGKSGSSAPKKPIPDIDDVDFPYRASGGVTVFQLGRIKWDDPTYSSKSNMFPVGYVSERTAASYMNRGTRVTYRSEILEGPQGPVFRVTASDDAENPYTARSATNCWTAVMVRARNDTNKKVTVSGPKMYGLSEYDVRGLIEQLPNADRCKNYWKNKKEDLSTAI